MTDHTSNPAVNALHASLPAVAILPIVAESMRRAADEIERLERELKIQRGVNDLAYIPHRHLVEQNDKLRARLTALEKAAGETPAEPVCEGNVELKIERGEPYGIRDRTGFICFFHAVPHFDGQDERYRADLAKRMRLADFITAALRRTQTTREQQWNDDKLIDWLVKRSGYSEGEAFAIVTRMQPPGSCSACGELGPCNCGAKKGGETGA